MKKLIKNQPAILFIIFAVIAVFSISAYTGVINKAPSHGKHSSSNYKHGGPINFNTSLNNKYFYDDKQVYLLVDLKAERVAAAKERTPLNISIVIDRSGSMADKNKLEFVKKSVKYIIDQAERDDYVSVVTYDDYVDVLQRSSKIDDKYDLNEMISRLQPGGFTNLSDGMFEGYDQVNKTYKKGYVNRVLLLSDGLANRGITDRHKLADMVREKNRRDGITISTFGVGNDFNENLMADIADYGKGNYYYIKNSSDIPEIFASEMNGVRNMVGQGTKIKIRYPKEYLSLNHVYGYPYDIQGDYVIIDFKDVFSEQNKSVLLKFDITRKIDRKLDFESELTYEDVTSNLNTILESRLCTLEPAADRTEYEKGYDENVRQNAAVFEANEIMEQALKDADDGKWDDARLKIQSSKDYMSGQMNEVAPSPEMKRQLDNINRYSEELESAETKTEDEKKEMQKSGKYDNYNTRKKNQ